MYVVKRNPVIKRRMAIGRALRHQGFGDDTCPGGTDRGSDGECLQVEMDLPSPCDADPTSAVCQELHGGTVSGAATPGLTHEDTSAQANATTSSTAADWLASLKNMFGGQAAGSPAAATVAGVPVKTAVLVVAAAAGAYYLWGKKRRRR